MSKLEDARIVTFKEDHNTKLPDGSLKLLYKKGSIHSIHKKLVAKLKARGAKMEVEEIDVKKVYEVAKKQLGERRKKEVQLAYEQ